jgi:hypothetical protein
MPNYETKDKEYAEIRETVKKLNAEKRRFCCSYHPGIGYYIELSDEYRAALQDEEDAETA